MPPQVEKYKPPQYVFELIVGGKSAESGVLEVKEEIICLRVVGMLFDTNKNFLLPSAIKCMRKLVTIYEQHPDSELLIVGHTDRSGDSRYNDPLSLERAEAVEAYLTDNVGAWLARYGSRIASEKRWGHTEDFHMLQSLPDFSSKPKDKATVKWFQETRGLDVDNIAGPQTRKQLITEYMAHDKTTLPANITPVTHGCGENFPLDAVGDIDTNAPDGQKDAQDRRAEIFVFDKPGIRPKPKGKNSKKGSKEYPEWKARAKTDNCGGGITPPIPPKPKPKLKCALEKVQYHLNGKWLDVPNGGFTDIGKGTSITFKAIYDKNSSSCSKSLKWGGEAAGSEETKKVTFNSSGNREVTVICCGKEIKIPVVVDKVNIPVVIVWDAINTHYTVDNSTGDATTDNRAFVVEYVASADIDNNQWLIKVKKIIGGVDIAVHMGGFTEPNPGVNITTEAQARAAIQDMLLESSSSGPATTWATEAAIKAHEVWHYDEWKCSCDHYWPDTEEAIEKLTVKYSDHISDESSAIQAIKTKSGGADSKILAFKDKARDYWFLLGDSPGDRPYRRGGEVLNQSINQVRDYATRQGWTVPTGLNALPQDRNHCYEPWLSYNP